LGPLLGPTIGGIIVSVTSWKWIFFINIPFGIISGALALVYLTEIKSTKVSKFDFFGFILIGSGLAGLAFSFQYYTIHYTAFHRWLSR
jgi:MFS family permease